MRYQRLVTLLLVIGLGATLRAGEYNPTLDVGETAPAWDSLQATDGKSYSSKDFAEAKVLVVAFTCETCPYADDYVKRLTDLAARLAKSDDSVRVVAINANSPRADSLEAMKEGETSYPFPYLKDETGEVAKSFGATRTPEFFVLNQDREVVYMGAFDDSTDADRVEKTYVADAVAAALAGQSPEVTETVPIGCNIRYPRRRR